MDGNWSDAIKRAQNHAPFLARGLERLPDLAALLADGQGDAALALAKSAGDGFGGVGDSAGGDVGIALRRERMALVVALAIGDLAGAFPLSRVMEELSDFADRALDAAITYAITRRVGDAQPDGFIALALGKHGARELNYSSDIDPILLFDSDTLPRRERDEPGEAAQRYARDIVRVLSDNTAEGYVFRVDLRLRPASEVSPLAIPCEAALTHYESSALAWERAAFIRARAASGAIEAGNDFLAAIRPFVWRRSLDFGAIDEITRLTKRIRSNHDGPTEPGPGFNVKQGRGGIREVEFFAQTHQLIHGGRNPALRCRGTREALDALAEANIISAGDAQVMGDSYDWLRTIEHRLQMVADQQTHSLPEGEALDNVAALQGLADGHALVEELTAITDQVAARYDRLIEDDDEASAGVAGKPASLKAHLKSLDFAEPGRLAKRISGWSDGRFRALRSDEAQRAFEALLPDLMEALSEAPEPERALARWETMLGGVSSAINLFRLLEARPALLDQLVGILTLAPPLADELARRPDLLDALIDRSALDLPGGVDAVAERMRLDEDSDETGGDYERQLDRIRIVTGEARFALGVQLTEAAQDPLAIGAALSRTAQAALIVACEAAETEFARKHGRIAGCELLVIGLGRFGGGALTHASDLDIIYLFTGEHGAESDGDRPLGATLYFNRLAQRVSAALSVPTAQGALYEVDTRLRPQGNQGPLAASVESFALYQRDSAWTWEHMALTRARVLVGSEKAQSELRKVIDEVLRRERDADVLRQDVLKMRRDMAKHKPPRGELDAKLSRGGLIDCEFMIHYLQLRERTAFDPDLGPAIKRLVADKLLSPAMIDAYDLMTRMLVANGLLAPAMDRPAPAAAQRLAAACERKDYETLLRDFTAARQSAAQEWAGIFGENLETIE